MLSQTELELLKKSGNFDANYTKSLRHLLHKKVQILHQELKLLESAGFFGVANNRNRVVEFSDRGENANQAPFQNRGIIMVRSPGFEPGSSAWEADVLAKLDYDRLK